MENVPDIVTACIYLHNFCLIHTDGFDMQWAKQAEEDMKQTRIEVFGKLHNNDMFYIAETSILQMQSL